MKSDDVNLKVELPLLLALSTLWGSSFTFLKVGVETLPPLTLISGRTLIGGALLLAIIHWRGLRFPRDRGTWIRFAVQACLNSVFPFTMLAWAEMTVDASLATILNSTSPIFTFLLTAFVFRHETVTLRKLIGVIAGVTGIALIVGVQALAGLGHALWAQLAIVVATLCYAGAAILGREFRGLDPMLPAAGSLICGGIMVIPACLIVDRPWTLSPSADSLAAMVALGVLSTAVAFVIYFRLVATLGSVGATAQAYLRVPIGVAVSVIFLGETLSSTAWIGLVCVIVGVAAMTIPQRARTIPQTQQGPARAGP